MSNIISGSFFPSFDFPIIPDAGIDAKYLQDFLTNTYPSSGEDLAKLIFWCFVSGFSERIVPQIISNVSGKIDNDNY